MTVPVSPADDPPGQADPGGSHSNRSQFEPNREGRVHYPVNGLASTLATLPKNRGLAGPPFKWSAWDAEQGKPNPVDAAAARRTVN